MPRPSLAEETALLAARTLLEDLAGERVAAAKHQLNDFLTAPEFRDLGASSCASAQADALERVTYYRHAREPRAVAQWLAAPHVAGC